MFVCLCALGVSIPDTGMGFCISRAACMPRCQQDQRPVTRWTVPKPSYQRDPRCIYTNINFAPTDLHLDQPERGTG